TLARARRHFARFCADEIARLLRAAPRISAKGERRTLRADDICMLVHRRAEANPLVEELRRAQIPYSFYKQDGLWQSEEARHLGCLLKALARPEERQSLTRALLTRFFRIEPTMLAQCDDLPPRHPARLLFQQWADFAAERDWA